MGGSISINSALGRGTSFYFEATFDLQPTQSGAVSFGPSVGHTRVILPSMMPNDQELADEYRLGLPPLRFLVVDDNAINKRLFERTVSHMFKQQKRVKPIFTFAANGTLSICVSLLLLSTLCCICILNKSPQIVGQEAVDIFTESFDTSLNGSFTKSSLDSIGSASDAFDCVFMDREMPVMDGVEATRRIVTMQRNSGRGLRVLVPIIGLSASVENAECWRAAGMNFLLGKPFSRKDLSRVLQLVDARRVSAATALHNVAKLSKVERSSFRMSA
jgi:CheY-like chemotaxis protein